MGRSHAKALKDWKRKKDLEIGYIDKEKSDFPGVSTVVSIRKGKRHSAKCGCLSDGFIEAARRNLYCAITQCGNSAETFAQCMRDLGNTMHEASTPGKAVSVNFTQH